MELGAWEPELYRAQLYRQITHYLVENKLYNLCKEEALYMDIFMMVRSTLRLRRTSNVQLYRTCGVHLMSQSHNSLVSTNPCLILLYYYKRVLYLSSLRFKKPFSQSLVSDFNHHKCRHLSRQMKNVTLSTIN